MVAHNCNQLAGGAGKRQSSVTRLIVGGGKLLRHYRDIRAIMFYVGKMPFTQTVGMETNCPAQWITFDNIGVYLLSHA
jgi:hypothetical protein